MSWYNLTAVNASGILPITQSVNELYMFFQLGNIILMVIFFIPFISFTLYNKNPKLNMMFASFGVAIFSIFFRIFNLVPDYTPFFWWALFAVSIMTVTFTK